MSQMKHIIEKSKTFNIKLGSFDNSLRHMACLEIPTTAKEFVKVRKEKKNKTEIYVDLGNNM